jgi:hypothetical protein
MLKNYFNKQSQLSFKLLWILLWLSIGAYPVKKKFFNNNISLVEILLQVRLYAPLIIFTIIIFLFTQKKIKFNINNKVWTFLLMLIFVFQAIGLVLNEERNFEPISWILFTYSLIVCFVISNLEMINLKKIIFLNLFFILLAFIIFIYPVYVSFFNLDDGRLFMYSFSKWNDSTFGSPNVRVTGIARYCLLIGIFIYAYLITKNNKKKITLFISLILIYFFMLNIWMLQSRLMIGSLFIVFFSTLLLKKKIYNNHILIGFFAFTCVIVYFSGLLIQDIKKNLIITKTKTELSLIHQIDKNQDYKLEDGFDNYNKKEESKLNKERELLKEQERELLKEQERELSKEQETRLKKFTTSGRIKIWTELINAYDKSKIFGYGVQADRFLLIDPDRNLSTNASNATMYIFSSGGYFAIIVFIIIILKSILLNLKIIINNWKNKNLNFFDMLAYMQINLFLIRQFFENSFSVFSIDLMLFACSFFYLIRKFQK